VTDDASVTPDDIAVLQAKRAPGGEIVDLTIVQATAALAQLVGTTTAEATGRGLLELLPWHDRSRFDSFVGAIETATAFAMEFAAKYGGVDRLMKVTASPFGDGLMVVVRDVTAERRVADSLRHGIELFEAITRSLNDAVAVWSAVRDDTGAVVDFRYEFVNASAERLTGLSAAELVGTRVLERFPQRREQGIFDRYLEVLASGEPLTIEIPWGNAGEVHRVVEASIVRFGDGMVSASREITAHKLVEEQLRASELRYRLLTDYACDGVLQHRDGVIEWVSPSVTSHFGWTSDDLVGGKVSSFLHPADVVPPSRDHALAAMGRSGDRQRVRLRRKDGTWNWIDHRSRLLPGADGELGSIGVTILWNVQAEVDALDALDEAERGRTELEERLVQAQKLESLGQLTGGVAHDFNNLLTVIVSGTEMLRDGHADDPVVTGLSGLVLGAAQRGAELTRQLLAFARRQTLQPSVVDPSALVDSMSELLRSAVGESIAIDVGVDIDIENDIDEPRADDAWLVSIDPSQFEATVMNLCINARDAMPNGGTVTIRTRNLSLGTRERGEIEPGSYVWVSVTDTGIGMSSDVLQHAFDPFFTTKGSTRGSGLGLSTVYGFIKQSGGHVTISSEEGGGTTVDMFLPRSQAARTTPVPSAAGSTSAQGRGESILVVEDDEPVRTLAVRLLRQLGYVVIEATAGEQALDVLRGESTVDLLFTDIVMPGGLTGSQLAVAARALRPALRVLYTSGYTENVDLHLVTDAELLSKPYRQADLAAAIRRALDTPQRDA
jgi:PAS domain S-box-containing protein